MKQFFHRFCGRRIKGFTLLEVLIAMTIFTIAYAAIANMLVQGFVGRKKGVARVVAAEMASTRLKILNSLPQPLYVGFPADEVQEMQGDEGAIYERLKDLQGNYLPDFFRKLVDPQANHFPFNAEADKIMLESASSTAGVVFKRETWKQIETVSPCMVHIWVKISWTQESTQAGEESQEETYELEALLTRLNEFD